MPFVTKNFKLFLWGSALVLLTACGNEEGQRNISNEENVGVVTESNGTETSGFEDNATQIPETNTTVDQNSTDETGNTTEENTADEGNTTIPDADTTPPVIMLNGEENITIDDDSSYVELGATAVDARDGAVEVTISGTVDTNILGVHTVTYSAVDKSGNKAETIRTVHVIDITPPVITLNGESNITITNGEAYVELGATAMDNRDGDVNVSISGNVDTTQAGTYTITYTATDSVGNSASITRTLTVTIPQIVSINMESNATFMNLGEQALLTVYGIYTDGHTKEITDNIVWEITPADSAEINGNIFTAKKDGQVKIKAKVDNLISNALVLEIYWEVNSHKLPPEPDKALNDSTLLGIDVNNNGVRDDVERYIYTRFMKEVEYPKTKTALAMQYAWATQKVLENPVIESKKYLDDAIDCQYYWLEKKTESLSGFESIKYLQKHGVFDDSELNDIMMNTKLRIEQDFKFNEACSGHIFHGRGEDTIDRCQTNIDLLGE